MALHLPEGRHFLLGVDRDQPLPADPAELQRLVADLQLFAVHAQDAALRLLVPEPLQPERPALTPRELEALRWTMEGKTRLGGAAPSSASASAPRCCTSTMRCTSWAASTSTRRC